MGVIEPQKALTILAKWPTVPNSLIETLLGFMFLYLLVRVGERIRGLTSLTELVTSLLFLISNFHDLLFHKEVFIVAY